MAYRTHFLTKSARNDFHRDTLCQYPGASMVVTRGVSNSPHEQAIIGAVVEYTDFNGGNDPYGEHDFGKVTVEGEDYFFKFDDYTDAPEGSLPEGMGPLVLTIMRTDEY